MKKVLSAIICLAMVLSLSVFAYAETEGDFTYDVIDGEAEITLYSGVDAFVLIPSTLGGYPVTSLYDSSFFGCSYLTSIEIPDSVTNIGYAAFYGCTELTSITISDFVTSIDGQAFYDCTSLTEINVGENNEHYCSIDGVFFDKDSAELVQYPAGKTDTTYTVPGNITSICDYAFKDCTRLTSITIPDSVTSIGDFVFSGCTGLTSIVIPDNVTSIGESEFDGCTGLTSVTIGNCVTDIGNFAFYNCKGLTSITIPDSITSIGGTVFFGCTSLTEINVDEDNEDYSSIDGVLFNKSSTKLIQYPIGKTDMEYTVPDGVTEIGLNSFYGCTELTSVTVSDRVTKIGDAAFSECTSLTSLAIPDSVTEIGFSAFRGCTGLTSIEIPDSVISIEEFAFYDCTALDSIYIYNAQCGLDMSDIIPTNTTIYGYRGSTAEAYAKKCGNRFVVIGGSEYLPGDVDLSGGTPTIADALTLFKHVAGVALITDADALEVADVDGTAGVTIADALTLFKFVAGVISEL